MPELVILLLVVPLGGAVAAALGVYVPRRSQHGPGLGGVAALCSLAACLALLIPLAPAALGTGQPLVYPVGGWGEPVGIALYLDGLAWTSSLVGLLVASCALLFAVAEGKHPPRFYFFFLLLVLGMEGVILTGDLFNLFVFLQILSIASYILIAGGERRQALVASFRYLLISSLGIGFFLLGIFLFYQATGTLSLRLMAASVQAAGRAQGGSAFRTLELAVICLAVGAGVKTAFVPFHAWLPDAHASAPHPVSAVLSGVMIKVSFLVLWRLVSLFGAGDLQQVLLWVGGLTAVFGVVAAIAQSDCKRLLAFHSVSQMGYIVASFGAGTAAALGASLYHLVNHSLFKSLLFLSVGAVIRATGERDIGRLKRLGGLAGRLPAVFGLFLVGALSIAGLPPFNGYASKGFIASGLQPRPLAYLLILAAGAGTVASFLKLSGIFLTRQQATSPEASGGAAHATGGAAAPLLQPPAVMLIAMTALAVPCIATGLLPGAVTRILSRVVGAVPVVAGTPRTPFGELYSPTHLAELAGTLAAGLGLYLLATRTGAGGRLLAGLRRRRTGLNFALALVVLGFVTLVLLTWAL